MSWGGVFIVYRHVNEMRERFGVSAWDIVWLRFVPASLILLLLLRTMRSEAARILRRAWWPVLWVGALTTTVYNGFLITGEERVPAAVASLTIALGPSMTFVLSLAFLSERATWRKVAGIVLSVVGLVYISMSASEPRTGPLSLRYLLITVMAPASWSVSTVIGKRVLRDFDPLTLTAVSVVLGTLFVVPAPLVHGNLFRVASALPVSFWASIAYLVLLPTVFGYLVWYKALQYLEATQVSMFVFLVPVFGVVFSTFGEALTGAVLGGGGLILAGVILTNYGGNGH